MTAAACAAMAVLALASCSVDQPVNISGSDGISFRATVGASTKAAEVNASNLTGFNVTAIGNGENYFTDMEVSVSSGTCTPARTYYWPSYELGFYAYANVSGGTVSIENSAKTITGVTPAAAAAEQTDMIVAYETGDKEHNESSGVPLNFRHALSQVVVKAANLSTSGIQIKVAGVKLGNILDRGTFTYPATTTSTQNSGTLSQSLWNTSAAEYTDYVISKEATDSVLASTAKSIMFGGAAWMVIPQQLTARASFQDNTDTGSSIGVMVQILDAGNNQLYPASGYAYTNIPIGTNWEPGKKYTYTLNFLDEANGGGAGVDENDDPVLGNPIRFTLTVDDWDPQNVQTLPNGTSAIVGLLMSTPGGLRRLSSGETLSVSSAGATELSGETLDELHLSLVDVAETVIPASKFTLSKSVLTPSDSDVELELTGDKPVALDYDTEYRGPNLVVEDGDDNVLAEFAVEGEFEMPDPANGHAWVDLGLRSGGNKILFATMNVGASSEEEYGDYFAWGETSKRYSSISGDSVVGGTFEWSNTPYHTGNFENTGWSKYISTDEASNWSGNGESDNLLTLQATDDVASVMWGGDWRMPDKAELQMLISEAVDYEWTEDYNGVAGLLVTGKGFFSGASLFLPAAGSYYHDNTMTAGIEGRYWSRSLDSDSGYLYDAWYLAFSDGYYRVLQTFRVYGLSVRPVRVVPE